MATVNPVSLQRPNHVSSLKLSLGEGGSSGGGGTDGSGSNPIAVSEHYIVDFPITEEVIDIALPSKYYSPNPPFVLAMVNGGVTEVTVEGVMEDIQYVGMVHTKVRFTFAAHAVGKRCNAWLVGGA